MPKATKDFAVERKKLSDLTPDKRNANRGTERGSKAIAQSLKDYGAGRSIVLDKHGNIIAGNKTAENAAKAGLGEDVLVVKTDGTKIVAVQRMDLDLAKDAKAKGLAIADNRAGELSLDWDPAVLASFESEIDLTPYFTPAELAAILPAKELLTDEDEVPEPPKVPVTKRGDLWILGDHRLLCGDATVEADVRRLMGATQASCMWTDPPYGVNYTGKTKRALKIQNDGQDRLRELLDASFRQADSHLQSGASVYVAHPAGALNVTFGSAFLAAGWRLHQTLIWDKGTMVLGHSDYHFAHEPIFYGYTAGDGRLGRGGKGWYGDDSQRSILQFPKPSRSESHPTMKPVALIEQCLKNSTEPTTPVYDPFGGSGSTLIACEKTGRKCFMMEIDPVYCDVIVERWQNATGKKAVLDGAA